jgi:hypothetical protein
LTLQAFQLRYNHRYALHPIEAALQYHRAEAELHGEDGHGGGGFEAAEAHYRAGAQGLRLPEIPQLPQQLRELSRLGLVDRASRKARRKWAEECRYVFAEDHFFKLWTAQGKRGEVEHQVYYDQEIGRWIKRLYHGVNNSIRTGSRPPMFGRLIQQSTNIAGASIGLNPKHSNLSMRGRR